MYLEFTNGTHLRVSASDLEAARKEAVLATEETGLACALLADDWSKLGGTSFRNVGVAEFIDFANPSRTTQI